MKDTAIASEPLSPESAPQTRAPRRPAARPRGGGADRLTVALFSLASFLVVLALLAGQFRLTAPGASQKRVIIVRKVYETRVVETVIGARGGGTSVSQSQSSSGLASTAYSAPTTRTSKRQG